MSFVKTDDEAIAPTDQSKAIAHLCIVSTHQTLRILTNDT